MRNGFNMDTHFRLQISLPAAHKAIPFPEIHFVPEAIQWEEMSDMT